MGVCSEQRCGVHRVRGVVSKGGGPHASTSAAVPALSITPSPPPPPGTIRIRHHRPGPTLVSTMVRNMEAVSSALWEPYAMACTDAMNLASSRPASGCRRRAQEKGGEGRNRACPAATDPSQPFPHASPA